ncbi:MAG: helix-turn-helix transcriptional regulator [Clostridia bacterium]|nr:helix-turn-helix transcriptional regulator [Clostridia bacterium]
MDYSLLNPIVHSLAVYEKPIKPIECVGYDSKIIYVISGDLSGSIAGEKLGHLNAGHLLYIPAGVEYKLKAQYLRCAVMSFDLFDGIGVAEGPRTVTGESFDASRLVCREDISPFDSYVHVEDMESERDRIIDMCSLFTSGEGLYLAALSAAVKSLLVKIAETVDEHALPTRMVTALDAYIRENIGEEISNTEIGAIFGYHPFYVSKMLKDKKGITLRQYIISYRLKLACEMLRYTAKSINEIAEECGFTDASYFTKTFKAAYGETPKAYRGKYDNDII